MELKSLCPVKSRSNTGGEGRRRKGRGSHQGQGGEGGGPATATGSSEAVILSIRFWLSSLETEFQKCPTSSSKLSLKVAAFIRVCVTRVGGTEVFSWSRWSIADSSLPLTGIWPCRKSAACHQTDGNEGERERDHVRVRNMFTEASVPSWDPKAAVCTDWKLRSQWWKGHNVSTGLDRSF